MTGEKRLQASRDQARKLRQLLERTGNGIPHLPRLPASAGKSVVVQLLADIDADDYDQHDAALLALQEGTFVDTGQRVSVRCISDEIAFADSRVIVEPVGRLGLCFEYCSCRLPSLLVDVNRLVEVVGPQASARGTDTYDWTDYTSSFGYSGAWGADLAWDHTPEENAGASWEAHVHEFKPMRFRIRSYAGAFADFSVDAVVNSESQNRFASLGTLPPAASHLSPIAITRIELPVPIGTNVNAFVADFPTTNAVWDNTITHYRIWIDGVDVTGVQAAALPVSLPHTWTAANSSHRTFSGIVSGTIGHTFSSPMICTGAQIEFDLWLKMRTNLRFADTNPHRMFLAEPSTISRLFQPFWWVTASAGDANAKRREKDTYKLTFADHGPAGGLSEFTLQPQTGWVLNYQNNVQQFYRHTGTGDAVYFSYGHEWPEVGVYLASQESYPIQTEWSGWVRYFPEASGHYTSWSQSNFGPWYGPYEFGVWNPQSTTTFIPQGRYRQGTVNAWFTHTKIANASSLFGNFPSSISLSLV